MILLLTGLLCVVQAPHTHAQEKGKKTKYEKKKERKNRKNRRLKRSKDKAKSNRRERRNARFKMRTRQGEKAHKGDIAGRRIQPIGSSKSRVVYPKPNPYAGRKRMSETRRVKFFRSSPRYSQRKMEKAGRPTRYGGTRSVRTTFAGKKAYKFEPWQTISRPSERARKTKRIVPRSASGAYVKNKRKNPYAWRERSKWEKAYKGDITGRTFRTKRTTDRPSIQGPPTFKNRSTTRRGDKPYSGRSRPRTNLSATRAREKSGKRYGRTSSQLSATKKGEKAYSGRAFPRRNISSSKVGERTTKRRGRAFANLSVMRRSEQEGKALRGKGGGSISGGLHNNKGRSLQGGGVRAQDIRVAKHTGNIRTTRGLKGGGSITAKMKRNNKGRPVRGFGPGRQDNQIARYQGNLRFGGRPPKNKGNSLTRAQWNNGGEPVKRRDIKRQDISIAAFRGKDKGSRKPLKGAGGSVSVLPWNNNEKPLEQKVPGKDTQVATSFQGKQKRGFRYVRNPSSAEGALKVKPVGKGTTQAMAHSGNVKRRFRYQKNPNSADGALKGIGPSRAMVQASQYQGSIKMSSKRHKNRHPSHKFEGQTRTASNQKKGFSIKVLWSRLFKKQENQPENLKKKERKPRFDRGEQGLWND